MVITIDGQAGSGKSTAARALAAVLGFELLNTGAMYRAAAWALARAGADVYALDPADPLPPDAAALVAGLTFDLSADRVRVGTDDVTDEVGTETLGKAASRVGLFPEVRRRLQSEQRRIVGGRDVVTEGRDQGTVVFPDAPVKFFFTAAADLRAKRRAEELGLPDDPAALSVLAADILARDEQDRARKLDPLTPAAGAVAVDTTTLGPDAVLALMLEEVRRCRANC